MTQTAIDLFQNLRAVVNDKGIRIAVRNKILHEVLVITCAEGLKETRFGFGDLNSQLESLISLLKIPANEANALRQARRDSNRSYSSASADGNTNADEDLLYDAAALAHLISRVFKADIPSDLTAALPHQFRQDGARLKVNSPDKRAIVRSFDEHTIRVIIDEDGEESEKTVLYTEQNQYARMEYLYHILKPGMHLNLLSCQVNGNTITPRLIIVEPDCLMDISVIASCFEDYGHHPLMYLVSRMKPKANTQAILLGNYAGACLDDIINNPHFSAAKTLVRNFRDQALEYASCTDFDGQKFKEDAVRQAQNLIGIVDELRKHYDMSKAILEPTFVCEKLGLQGRVDLMTTDMRLLVEQKSGRNIFLERNYKNAHGAKVVEKHYVQVLLYFGILYYNFRVQHPDIWLLYSKYPLPDGLLGVTSLMQLMYEALRFRNEAMALEFDIAENGMEHILPQLTENTLNVAHMSGFFYDKYLRPPLLSLLSPLHHLSPLERSYFCRMTQFVLRENIMSRVGVVEGTGSCVANLWNMPLAEKIETGNIIKDLTPSPSPSGRGDAIPQIPQGRAAIPLRSANRDRYALLKEYIKENRQKSTEAEQVLWEYLRDNAVGLKFRRQFAIDDFIVDFICLQLGLVIEVDGGYHNTDQQQRDDKERSEILRKYGVYVIRFSNEEVLADIDNVIAKIKIAIKRIEEKNKELKASNNVTKIENNSLLTFGIASPLPEGEGLGVRLFLPNFRRGDMVYVYSYPEGEEPDVRKSILYKATIAEIHSDRVVVKLQNTSTHIPHLGAASPLPEGEGLGERSQGIAMSSQGIAERAHGLGDRLFCIEHASSDVGGGAAIRSIYAFVTAPQSCKDLLLGQRAPRSDKSLALSHSYNPTIDDIILKAKQAQDYFLLVGPPGTGKTSMALQYMVREALSISINRNKGVNGIASPLPEGEGLGERSFGSPSLLLMSYTNRAVDEICGMLCDNGIDFIRIGSELSCADIYQPYLLQNRVGEKPTLKSMRQTILDAHIIVGTTSMIWSRSYLFNIKHFSLAIIDEASQILEPNLIGLLATLACKFILIGDYKQLPAVVQQSDNDSGVSDPALRAIGLTDCKNSLFERLIRTEMNAGRTDFIGTLRRQGRMHPEIAEFPNREFYFRENLAPVPLPHQQAVSIGYTLPSLDSFDDMLKEHRVLFIESEDCRQLEISDKVNVAEAKIVAEVLRRIHRFYGKEFNIDKTVGVIVPYRNQIAMIRSEIERLNIPELEDISIDTVERYQGSQRDVIIYSFTIQRQYQLDFLTANTFEESGHTIDRKLNVALTRARKQLVMTGNRHTLSASLLFSRLMQYTKERGGYIPTSAFSVTGSALNAKE